MTETALLQQAEAHCAHRGVRFTPIRRRVLELIGEASGGLKAYDLLDRLAKDHAAARPPTVYRALEFLIEQGLVHRIESLNAYVACPCPEHAHRFQLLICRDCGRVEELHLDEINEQLASQCQNAGLPGTAPDHRTAWPVPGLPRRQQRWCRGACRRHR